MPEKMTREYAHELLTSGAAGVTEWNNRKVNEKVPSLAELDLTGARLEGVNFERVNLNGAILVGADLTNARMKDAHLHAADLSDATMTGTRLERAELPGATLCRATMTGTILKDAILKKADLRWATLERASFQGAQLQGANFSEANLSQANLSGAQVEDAIAIGVRGAWGPRRATLMGVHEEARVEYAKPGDIGSWTRLRSIGTYRIFGASYASLVGIVSYAFVVRWWNDRRHALSELAKEHESESLSWLVERLPLIDVPRHLAWQLSMLFLLAAAATIYAARCPDPIKEATETGWTRQLGGPLFEYRCAAYDRIRYRYACWVLYIIGGGFTFVYLATRAWVAVRFLASG